ncbi:MAG: HD domain-containing protein [Methylocystaceae bacterium]
MLYIVGGTVRDLVVGKSPKDLDLAVEDAKLTAEMLCHITEAHYFILDEERNMVRVFLSREGWQLDLTSLQGAAIEDDLSQRDFSINAMAIHYGSDQLSDADNILDLLGVITTNNKFNEKLIDPYNGKQDLQQKLVTKVSDQIFNNDPVRMLRAVRIAGQLGCTIETETEQLIKKEAQLLKSSAGERLREEIMLILNLPDSSVWVEKLVELGLIEQILPPLHQAWLEKNNAESRLQGLYPHSLHALDRLEELGASSYAPFMSSAIQLKKELMQQLVPGRTRLQLLKMAGLIHDLGKTLPQCTPGEDGTDNHATVGAQLAADTCCSLALSKRETDTVSRLVRNHYRIFEIYHQTNAMGLDIYALMEELNADFPLLVLLAHTDWQSGKTDGIRKEQHFQEFLRFLIREYYENYMTVKAKPLVTGEDVMQVLGISPSPKVGEILGKVRQAQFMREITNREAALAYIQKL